ncbi:MULTISPECIES: hypothetical protein [unclassified Leclercia]|uniref:Uncharacterized protein n=1 Tax=Leclercia barmai TaxID=2785629 RepID=A0ABS7S2L9_9ENTR|nr:MULTISPECIES: hypothetical protein [unclassified Leclercia]MBZ0059583.1 hypothetical protein [Leclercia sp. EMC7]MCM5697285.1 hypothetical protein [Leclercia sp. LTM01]MCM5702120.1 hypothetical protein [Leclercia sp. LTM14]
MKAFYSMLHAQANFVTVKEYDDIDGRRDVLIIQADPMPMIAAIDATERHKGVTLGHEVLATLELNSHEVHHETLYSEGNYWQSEHLYFEPMRSVMRANLAARCGLKLLEGDELANVKAAEATSRRLQMYNRREKDYGKQLLNTLQSPATLDHPATWTCILGARSSALASKSC